MPSRVVDREHRNAASVLAAGIEHQAILTTKLTERPRIDGTLAAQQVEQEQKAARASRRERAEMRRIHRDALIGWRSMLQGMAIAAGDRELASDFRLPRLPAASTGNGSETRAPEDEPDGGPPPAGPFPEDELPDAEISSPDVELDEGAEDAGGEEGAS